MSKKNISAQPAPQKHDKPAPKPNVSTQHVPQKHDKPVLKSNVKSPTAKTNAAQRAREAKDARKFFLVLGIGTVLLVLFLYFIFIGRRG